MLARRLCLGLGIEFIVYGMIGVLLSHYAAWQSWPVVLLIMGVAIGFRALLLASTFIGAWFYRAERPPAMRIGSLQAVRLYVNELCVFSLLYCFLQPLERWLMQHEPDPKLAPQGPPVLLIHGFFCNSGVWWAMKRYLTRQGLTRVFTINMEPIFGIINIDRLADQVAARIEHICQITGTQRVILVGHSMGGLASRAYLYRNWDKDRIAKIITLGTPHHGTHHVRLFRRVGIRQMQPENRWLATLNQTEMQPGPVPITSIYSYQDNFITPQDSSQLAHAKNLPLTGVGHLEMVFSRQCQELVYQEICEVAAVAA
jgi:predicted alpha/beta hydrolase family esterase